MSEDLKIPPMPGLDYICTGWQIDLAHWGQKGWSEAQAQARRADEAEMGHLKTIDQRDAAEDALADAVALVTGTYPEWSNVYGYADAMEDMTSAIDALKAERDALKARVAEMEVEIEAMKEGEYYLAALKAESTLAQRDREVLALREGIQKHKDRYIFTNPDHEDYELWKILASTAQAGAEAERRVRQDEREKAAKAVDAVEELPGHMPDEMWAAIQNDRDAFEEALRITVRQSKEEAKSAILGTEPNP